MEEDMSFPLLGENMRVAIPSKGRPSFLSLSIFKEPIVFVEPQDEEAYQKANPDLDLVILKKDNGGISYVRNSILEHMKDELFCMADDDITGIYAMLEGKMVQIDNFDWLFKDIEHLMKDEKSLTMMGLCSKAYAWCQMKKLSWNSKILNIAFINGKNLYPSRYDENIAHGEDVDMCLQILRSGKSTAVYNLYAYTNDMKKLAGGCGTRSKEEILKNIDYMNLKWGEGTVTPVIKGDAVNLKVKWTQS